MMRVFNKSALGALLYINILCVATSINLYASPDHTIVVSADRESQLAELVAAGMPENIAVDSIGYEADVVLSESEFSYLVDIPAKSILTHEQVARAIFYLFRKNKFQTITVVFEPAIVGYNLHFNLKSYWTLGKIKLHGFLLGKDRYQYQYLMERGDRFDHQKHKHSLERIQEMFKQEGYYNARIKERLVYDERVKEITVHLTFDRGPLFRVGAVDVCLNHLDGSENNALERKIALAIKTLRGSRYNRTDLNKKMTEIKQCLLEEGYWQSVIELQERLESKKCRVDCNFFIDLQQRKEFVFVGNTFFSKRQLLDHLLLFGRFALILPTALLQEEIVALYHKNGFPQVKTEIVEEDNRLFFIIEEGSAVKGIEDDCGAPAQPVAVTFPGMQNKVTPDNAFGKTVVMGSSSFPFEYLMRELTYRPGEPWSPRDLKQSLVALKDLELFDNLHIYPYQGDVITGNRPLILKAFMDDPFELRFRGGCAVQGTLRDLHFNGLTYKLGGSAIFKNPFNQADYFIANADFTRPYRILELQYWRPWLLNKPIRTLFQLYNNAFQYPSLRGIQRNLYQVTHQGFLLGLSRKWAVFEAGCNFGFEWMETVISNNAPQEGEFNRLVARAINFEPNLLDVKVPYFLMEPTLFINYLDDQLYPTQGFLTVLSIKGMIPLDRKGQDTLFVKCMAEQSLFVPLPRIPVVLALRLRLGYIVFQQFNNIMPSERFYLGGAFSLRSYQNDLCPPLGAIENGSSKPDFVPQGGKAMLNMNFELRFPVYKQLNGVVFQDFGFLDGGYFRDLVKKDLLAGTGFGLRYNTPIGPIRFDIGFKWSRPTPEVSPLAWFLTLGQAF